MSYSQDAEDRAVAEWIRDNHGILSRIAVACECTPQFVQQLAYGRSTSRPGHPAEGLLAAHGWPGHTHLGPRKRKIR